MDALVRMVEFVVLGATALIFVSLAVVGWLDARPSAPRRRPDGSVAHWGKG